jgi:hypothetical protein
LYSLEKVINTQIVKEATKNPKNDFDIVCVVFKSQFLN